MLVVKQQSRVRFSDIWTVLMTLISCMWNLQRITLHTADPFWQLLGCKKKFGHSHPNVQNTLPSHFGSAILYTEAHPVRPSHNPFEPDPPAETSRQPLRPHPHWLCPAVHSHFTLDDHLKLQWRQYTLPLLTPLSPTLFGGLEKPRPFIYNSLLTLNNIALMGFSLLPNEIIII